MWAVYFQSDPGFPPSDKTTLRGFQMGNLEANHGPPPPFTRVFLPANLKENGAVERRVRPIVRGGARGSSAGGFQSLVTHEAAPGFVCSGPRENHPSTVQLFHMSAMAAAVSPPPAVRYRGPTGHLQPGYNIGFTAILI